MVYPRVGGATKVWGGLFRLRGGLSPRGRGTHHEAPHQRHGHGSIPAWAGQPGLQVVVGGGRKVYPRVGGATAPSPPTPPR